MMIIVMIMVLLMVLIIMIFNFAPISQYDGPMRRLFHDNYMPKTMLKMIIRTSDDHEDSRRFVS